SAPMVSSYSMSVARMNGRGSVGLGWMNVLIGAWLIISPFVLRFAHYPAGISNNICVGVALIIVTLGGAINGLLKGLIVLMGAWLYASAFILNVPSKAYLWNNLILAFVVVICAVASESPYPQSFSRPQDRVT